MSVILVIDGHGVYRAGLRGVIQARFPDATVVDAANLAAISLNDRFDLILIDVGSVSYEALDLLADFHEASPAIRVAVMLTVKARADVLSYLSAGFHGVIHKLYSDEELLSAIDDLLSGRIYVPSWVVEVGDEEAIPPSEATIQTEAMKLTPRQREVLHLLAKGMSNKEVARELRIAEGTSKIHTAALLRALGARNRTEAAFMAAKLVRSSRSSQHKTRGGSGVLTHNPDTD